VPNAFDTLLDQLAAQVNRRVPPATETRAVPSPERLLPSFRPDREFAKAVDTTLAEIAVQQADMRLGGLRPGMAVSVRGKPVLYRVVDIDPAGGRVKVRQVRDQANDPAGVNFANAEAWTTPDTLNRVPEFDSPNAETNDFGKIVALTTGLREGEARLASLRARGRKLVAAKRAELSEALQSGKMAALEVVKAEAGLNAFCNRIGI
jgi:hypothetical protein